MRCFVSAACAAAISLCAVRIAPAQVTQKPTLTLEGARQVLAACESEAKKNNAGGVIAVVDDGGNLIALHRLDGTFAAGANISIGKARTAAMFKKPTRAFEEIIRNGRTAMVALGDFTPLQGGVPIMVDGQVVGAVGVSGAASAEQDEEIALAGADSVSGAVRAESVPRTPESSTSASSPAATPKSGDPSTPRFSVAKSLAAPESEHRLTSVPTEVLYFDRARVAAAFERGEPLFGGARDAKFGVIPSRRDSAGPAEIHADETDIMYIQSGAATLVTGGVTTGAGEIAAGETRGREIVGGETRKLGPGDVLIIPRGVPHWFKEVNSPLLYYVVKVRT